MTLTQYLRVLRQHWLIVLVLAALGVAGAAAYTSRQVPVYQAQTQVFVSAQGTRSQNTLSDLSESSSFSQQQVKSYAGLVTSRAVTEPVVKRLRLPYTPAGLAGRIDASPQLDTVLIDITVRDPDPERAAAVARAVTGQLQTVVGDLQSNGGRTESTVKLTVTRPPDVPTAPVSPRVPLNIALGLLLGLGLGVGAAVLRDQLNTTLRGASDLEQLTGSVPLGVVPFDASAPKQPLVTADAFGGRAEAFRTLRTNLQFADVDNPPRVIAVTSALPDEGKTTTACNIALILAQSGARVVLVEGDLRKPAVGRYLGLSNAAGLTNVLAGQHDLRDVVVGYERDLLAVLPSGPTPPNPAELLGSQQMGHLLNTLAEHYDVVIIDAPPLLPVTDAALLATAADGAILVVRHGRSRREETERALKALEAVSAKVLGTVLNFAPHKKGRNGYRGYGYGYGQAPADQVNSAAPTAATKSDEDSSRRGRRGRKDAPAQPVSSITLPDASLPLEPVGDRPSSPDGPSGPGSFGTGSFGPGSFGPGSFGPDTSRADATASGPAPTGAPQASGPQAAPARSGAWAPDMGWAPSPSDGWAPIADSSHRAPRGAERTVNGNISVFGGLSSTGPLPVVTAPGTDGLAVIQRTEGLEIARTAAPEDGAPQVVSQRRPERLEVHHHDQVPEALRLHPLPNETATDRDERTRETPEHRAPDTAPSGLRIGHPDNSGDPSWTQTSWFDAPPEEPDSPTAGRPTPEFEEIPPLLVDLSAPDLDLLEDERELLIPPQAAMPHVPTGVPRHHRSKRSL